MQYNTELGDSWGWYCSNMDCADENLWEVKRGKSYDEICDNQESDCNSEKGGGEEAPFVVKCGLFISFPWLLMFYEWLFYAH